MLSGNTTEITAPDADAPTDESAAPAAVVVLASRPDGAAARSWDVGDISQRKRRWYDRFEPPPRRLLDAPNGQRNGTTDRRGLPPQAVTPDVVPAPQAEPSPRSVVAPVATATVATTAAVVASAPQVAAETPSVAEAPAAPDATPDEVVVAPDAPMAPVAQVAPFVEYETPPVTDEAASTNGASSQTLRRLDGTSRPVAEAAAATSTLVDEDEVVGHGPVSMGLSESARYHNAEFEISEVETHDPVISRTVIEWIAVIAGALIVALVIKAALFQAFYIPSPSMVPTLVEDDRVLVNKLSYRLHDIRAGDVVVFERPPSESGVDESDLIKRVIGLPGDRIKAVDGKVFVDGAELDEYYLTDVETFNLDEEIEVGPGQIFVMGDNRGNSKDSRVYGTVDQDLVVGRAFVRVWPLSRIGLL